MGYIDTVLDRAFDGQALRAALGQTRASTSAAETVLELTRAAGKKGMRCPSSWMILDFWLKDLLTLGSPSAY